MWEDGDDDMPPWKGMTDPDEVEIVSPEGEVRSRVQAYYAGNMFVIEDMSVDVRAGDEIRRRLPNGNDEAFRVDDPKFYGSGGFGKHYQVKVSRSKIHPRKSSGNYTVHVTGANSRVNINSTDTSTNTVQEMTVFNQARELLASSGVALDKAVEIAGHIEEMEKATSQPKFSEGYQRFIAATADNIGVFAPILTALAVALAGLPHH